MTRNPTRVLQSRWPTIRPWHTNAALLLLGAGLIVLCRQFLSEHHHFAIGFSGVSGWSAILYIAAPADLRPDPVEDFKVITEELKSFDPALAAKPTILVAAKADVANPDKLKKLTAMAKRRKLPFYALSAVSGEGIEPLKYALAELVKTHRPIAIEPEPVATKIKPSYPPPANSAKGRA